MKRSVSLLCALSFFAVACSARQVRNETELQEAARLARAGDESGWRMLENTVRQSDAEYFYRRSALKEIGKIPSSRAEPILKENLTNRELRGEAALGLVQQRNEGNKQEIDQLIVSATDANLKTYNGLIREEIQALGEVDHPDAVRILQEQLRRDPNKDEAVIDALGKILIRRKQSLYHPLDFTQPLGQQSNITTETLLSSDEVATAQPESAATTNDPEKVLMEYLAGDGSVDTKDRAVQSIQEAHPPGVDYILRLIGQRSIPVKARIALVDYLTRLAVNTQDKSMMDKLTRARSRAGNAQLVRSINLSLQVLGKAFGVRMAGVSYSRGTPSAPPIKLPKEAEIIALKQKPYPGYSSGDVRTNLKKALAYYRLSGSLVERMESRVRSWLNAPENKEASERNLIFAALGRLYPNRDFYVLKAQGQDAFSRPGYFTTTLRLVTASSRGRSWQIAVLQRLWGLTAQEADMLRQIYLRDGKLLEQRMRL